MRFCLDHWEDLKAAVDGAGLWSLVAESGEEMVRKLESEAVDGRTVDNFDPLMLAHNKLYGKDPLEVFANDIDAPPERQCPICALNRLHVEHVEGCTEKSCDYPKVYDWGPDSVRRASQEALKEWKRRAS